MKEKKAAVTVKEQISDALVVLPDDATFDDAIELVCLLASLDRGLKQAEAGQTVTHEEARARMAKWLQ
jgi:predicted transcriptional regulator